MKIFYVSSVLLALTFVSCQEDNSFFNEPTPIRAYDTDARIMSQFVEVDKTTGTYVLNPDKKITASDYVINKSRGELMEVSQINKDRFLREMEEVNNQLSVVKCSGLASAFIYSTQTSDAVIDGDENDSFIMSRLINEPYYQNRIASLTLEEGKNKSTSFFSQSDLVMTISAGNSSAFYCAQVTLGDLNDEDTEIIYISGVKSFIPEHSYRLVSTSIVDSNKTISGMTVIGTGNISVSISR
ncbi:MAG: hypothetical protein K2J46_06335 [Muribaculaceae bacterium]|nr:hypothetical protein [Muribaculaceae bacterium]